MKKKKNIYKRRRVALFIMTILLLLAIAAFVIVRFFTVQKVEVEGNELYDNQVIEESLLQNDNYSWNSLYVYMKYKFFKHDSMPFIDTMEISLKNPHTLYVKVYEKGIMGYLYVPELEENVYFDKDGFVVETSQRVIEDVPKVEGVSCENVVMSEKLPIDEDMLKGMLTLTQTLKREEMIPDAITYGKTGSPVLTYGTIKIQMGSMKNLTQKVSHIQAIYGTLEGQSGTLHLENWTEDSPNIVFDKE